MPFKKNGDYTRKKANPKKKRLEHSAVHLKPLFHLTIALEINLSNTHTHTILRMYAFVAALLCLINLMR